MFIMHTCGIHIAPPLISPFLSPYLSAEMGDYSPKHHPAGYVSELQLFPGQTEDLEEKITELHREHIGKTTPEAEFLLLANARRYCMYAYIAHPHVYNWVVFSIALPVAPVIQPLPPAELLWLVDLAGLMNSCIHV